jgi:hypothetical protein
LPASCLLRARHPLAPLLLAATSGAPFASDDPHVWLQFFLAPQKTIFFWFCWRPWSLHRLFLFFTGRVC